MCIPQSPHHAQGCCKMTSSKKFSPGGIKTNFPVLAVFACTHYAYSNGSAGDLDGVASLLEVPVALTALELGKHGAYSPLLLKPYRKGDSNPNRQGARRRRQASLTQEAGKLGGKSERRQQRTAKQIPDQRHTLRVGP